ncbi:MAG: hypothetical protein XD63_1153 [Thermoanaerobacterales bacterium 50_218]|nr:MAG: hypothetical protein XD63_1153 [Thermoanaerobacterales bacterium 50_218]
MVGAGGFEPPTSWSQAKRAAKLRHAPFPQTKYITEYHQFQAIRDGSFRNWHHNKGPTLLRKITNRKMAVKNR